MVASGGGLSEGYAYDGPGVCLGDGQTEAEGVPVLHRLSNRISGITCGLYKSSVKMRFKCFDCDLFADVIASPPAQVTWPPGELRKELLHLPNAFNRRFFITGLTR